MCVVVRRLRFFFCMCQGHLVGTSSCPCLVPGSIGTHEESYSLRGMLYFSSRPRLMLMQSEESIPIMPFSNLGSLPWRSGIRLLEAFCTVVAAVLNRQLAVPCPIPAHATVEMFGALPYPR